MDASYDAILGLIEAPATTPDGAAVTLTVADAAGNKTTVDVTFEALPVLAEESSVTFGSGDEAEDPPVEATAAATTPLASNPTATGPATAVPPPGDEDGGGSSAFLIVVGAALLLAVVGGVLVYRRRDTDAGAA